MQLHTELQELALADYGENMDHAIRHRGENSVRKNIRMCVMLYYVMLYDVRVCVMI